MRLTVPSFPLPANQDPGSLGQKPPADAATENRWDAATSAGDQQGQWEHVLLEVDTGTVSEDNTVAAFLLALPLLTG